MRGVISPISSRKIVPPAGISSFPSLSRYAPVKLPFTWPNNSDSSSVSGIPAQLTGERLLRSRTRRVDGPRDDLLPRAALPRDKHLGVGTRYPRDLRLELGYRRARADQINVAVLPHRCPKSESVSNGRKTPIARQPHCKRPTQRRARPGERRDRLQLQTFS